MSISNINTTHATGTAGIQFQNAAKFPPTGHPPLWANNTHPRPNSTSFVIITILTTAPTTAETDHEQGTPSKPLPIPPTNTVPGSIDNNNNNNNDDDTTLKVAGIPSQFRRPTPAVYLPIKKGGGGDGVRGGGASKKTPITTRTSFATSTTTIKPKHKPTKAITTATVRDHNLPLMWVPLGGAFYDRPSSSSSSGRSEQDELLVDMIIAMCLLVMVMRLG